MSITWQLPAKTALSRLSAACWQAALLSCGHWGATAPSTTENHLIRGWWQLSWNCRHVVCSTCWIVFPCLNGWPPTEVAWFFSRLKVRREISSKMKSWKYAFRSGKHRPLLWVFHPNLPTSQLLKQHSTFGLSIRGTKQGLTAFSKRKRCGDDSWDKGLLKESRSAGDGTGAWGLLKIQNTKVQSEAVKK